MISFAENCLEDISDVQLWLWQSSQSAYDFDLSHPWCVGGCRVNRHIRSLKWCLIFMRFQCTQRIASIELIERIAKIIVIVAESVFRLFPVFSVVVAVNADKAHDGLGPEMNVLYSLLFRIACVYFQLNRNGMQNILRDDSATNK